MATEFEAWRNTLAVWAEAGTRGARKCRNHHMGLTCRERYPQDLVKWCDTCLLKVMVFHHDA